MRPQAGAQAPETRPFQYRNLETENTFRLLRLHAGQGYERIACSLQHHVLGSAPAYRALSYTWDKDSPRNRIHMPDESVFLVRDNLMNALRHVRDAESDCWLWIDAICINQGSDDERNHQVRLMANIYGTANVVLVWLQSAGQTTNIAKAFELVRAAVTHDGSEHSVYNYAKQHPDESWGAVGDLWSLRYWNRKWIIQEYLTARTVVLQAGGSHCSAIDLERFVRQVQTEMSRYTDRGSTRKPIRLRGAYSDSPGERLVLQRAEANNGSEESLLYEVVQRFSSNRCEKPEDHVYALYNLIGEHRRHLKIEYEARPVQRLVDVLRFVHDHEQLSPSRVLGFVRLLLTLFRINHHMLQKEPRVLKTMDLEVTFSSLGQVTIQDESDASIALRPKIKPLKPMPTYDIDTMHESWFLDKAEVQSAAHEVGRPDMTYFGIGDSGLHGLAACNLQAGDEILYLPDAELVFAVRRTSDRTATLLGRAYLFAPALENWYEQPFPTGESKVVGMNLATLLELDFLTRAPKGMVSEAELKSRKKRKRLVNWRLPNWRSSSWRLLEEIVAPTDMPSAVLTGLSIVALGLMLCLLVIKIVHPPGERKPIMT